MYYNGKNNLRWPWKEQSGLALPEDDTLTRWRRYEPNPVHPVSASGWDSVFACGQHVLRDSRNNRWVLFFCGFDGNHAQEGVSISDDGIHWRRSPVIRSSMSVNRRAPSTADMRTSRASSITTARSITSTVRSDRPKQRRNAANSERNSDALPSHAQRHFNRTQRKGDCSRIKYEV